MNNPFKILTSSQMNEIDRRTIEGGIPGIILMENAAQRVVELLVEKFSPLRDKRIVAVCGRGNNGGDGLAIARQLWVRFRPKSLHVILSAPASDLNRDAGANYRMLLGSGFPNVYTGSLDSLPPEARAADIVIDAVLGTGVNGAAQGAPLDAIRFINTQFPQAKVVAVDIPSGLSSNTSAKIGEFVRADYTITFTAYKISQVFPPTSELMGELRLGAIGTPPEMLADDPDLRLGLITPQTVAPLFAPRPSESNKGTYGHVLVVAGSRGKGGAATMAGLAALRAGAGLVTVASAVSAFPGAQDLAGPGVDDIFPLVADFAARCANPRRVTVATPASAMPMISSCAPELMTEPLPENDDGELAAHSFDIILELAKKKNVVALGPGLGTSPETVAVCQRLYAKLEKDMVVDADALNAMAGSEWIGNGYLRVLTPHPGEMSRLTGKTVEEIQRDRIGTAREIASKLEVHLVLKGYRSVLAWPDGEALINPTGTPAMATGGSGDILTGLIAGMLAQFNGTREEARNAIAAAVYLHGLAGEIGAREIGEKSLIATDMLRYLPQAIRQVEEGVR
jgi:NAD(P)H-hydrate epimerase